MTQEYIIASVKKQKEWSDSYGTYQGYALALKGIGEPVSLNKTVPVMSDPQIGEKIYGNLIQEKATNGRLYYRFQLVRKPVNGRDERAIQAQWAIGQAVQCYVAGDDHTGDAYANIEREAKHFYKMIDKVVGDE